MKKHFTGKQKAQIVLELLKEEKSVSQISSEYGVHPNQLYRWKTQVLEELPSLFEKDGKTDKAQQAAHDRQVEELYAEIGKLTTQLTCLKKIWPRAFREMNVTNWWSGIIQI
jgi:transposase-like protein